MSALIYTEGFIEDMTHVDQELKREELFRAAELVAQLPDIGSKRITQHSKELFGENIRKFVVSPFLLIYRYEPDTDTVYILSLMREFQAY